MSYELPDYLHSAVSCAINDRCLAAQRESLWAVRLKLTPFKDGDQWCVLFGTDLQTGIAAFGDTPEKAMFKFEEAMGSKTGAQP